MKYVETNMWAGWKLQQNPGHSWKYICMLIANIKCSLIGVLEKTSRLGKMFYDLKSVPIHLIHFKRHLIST